MEGCRDGRMDGWRDGGTEGWRAISLHTFIKIDARGPFRSIHSSKLKPEVHFNSYILLLIIFEKTQGWCDGGMAGWRAISLHTFSKVDA